MKKAMLFALLVFNLPDQVVAKPKKEKIQAKVEIAGAEIVRSEPECPLYYLIYDQRGRVVHVDRIKELDPWRSTLFCRGSEVFGQVKAGPDLVLNADLSKPEDASMTTAQSRQEDEKKKSFWQDLYHHPAFASGLGLTSGFLGVMLGETFSREKMSFSSSLALDFGFGAGVSFVLAATYLMPDLGDGDTANFFGVLITGILSSLATSAFIHLSSFDGAITAR